jgi:hypothetical protein
MKIIASVILGAAIGALITQRNSASQVESKVWFFPINAQPFSPIDENTIEQTYDISSLVQSRIPDLKKLLKASGSEGGFNPDECRLKIKISGETIVMDSSGVVKSGGKTFALSQGQREELLRFLQSCIPRIGSFRK